MLKPLGPRLKSDLPFLLPVSDYDRRRSDRAPWRKWYGLARWKKLRWSCLVRDHFTCAMCGRIEADTGQLHADHVRAHRGDPARFWDAGNVQTLCARCHNSKKQKQERRAARNKG